ncbi:uncharacterized protein LOC120682727 [Panicum virgatum]|uniref:Uncharacterized protein n=1 Tax=Panicum virgatum TaxID=38727 RepID=A0A8T0PVS8_PANVG|nr:uncharacterized protein LOC120682727 [Panicum virgatum]KAG2566577.1 hypothetical protein PVAP13_7NG184753 [Panicum virgatum]
MAALSSSAPSKTLALHASVVVVSPCRCGNKPAIAASVPRRRRGLGGLTTNSSGMNSARFPPIKGSATRISAADPGSTPSPVPSGGNLPIPGIPPWAQWLVGAIVFAVPLYRQFRAMEDKIEKTAEVAIEVIDKVAEETEKIADEVADRFPGNETLKKAASKIKAVAEEIEEDADKAEALIEKVDEIMEEMDSIVDSIIDKDKKKKK